MTPPPQSRDDVTPTGPAFVAGDVFAGRYRMVTLLGRTDSAWVWQASDLVLQTDVALKVIPSITDEERERIQAQVRLTRQIAHPAVRRVFDVGEADGIAFCSMELVRGEALAVVLKRVGRLPSERVAEIGEQLFEVLAAAHAQEVLHGDVRPENILVDDRGLIHITDFAIPPGTSRPPRIAHSVYTAPEHRAPDALPDEQGDLYAGGVVLYEMVVGHVPADERPARPSTLVGDVDRHLERTILQLLQTDPRRRPASAAAVAAELAGAVAMPRQGWSSWAAGGALALMVLAAAGLIRWLIPAEPRPRASLTDQDTIVIADFVNTTGDPVFDGSLEVALAVALEQSPFLKVYPDERIRETLQLMQRPPDAPLTRSTARDLARRERLKALVAGSIGRLGSLYLLTVEAIDAETGDVMAREQVQVEDRNAVLASLGRATASLRSTLGESLSLVRRFDTPLPQATTPSLEALHAYSLALDQGRANLREEAIPHLRRAIELDPDFAMALALLSGVYANTGRFQEAPQYSRRAFDLRGRVSQRERYMISWRYYVDAAQAWDNARDLAVSWTTTYPREPFAFNSLGLASAAFGDHERAVNAFRRAIEIDRRFVPPFPNLAGSLIALNRYDEAREMVREARSEGIRTTGIRRAAYVLAFLSGDPNQTEQELAETRNTADAPWAFVWEARTAAAGGRINDAHELFGKGIAAARAAGLSALAAQWTTEDAESHALVRQCDVAGREAAEALTVGRDNFTLERAGRAFALCGAADQLSAVSTDLADRYPEATLTQRIHVPVARAALALRRNDGARALELLEPVQPYDRAPSTELWAPYLRALALAQTGNQARARSQFQEIIAHRGAAPTSPLYALAHLGLARAAASTGAGPDARRAYETFFSLWDRADPDVPFMTEARQEHARLK